MTTVEEPVTTDRSSSEVRSCTSKASGRSSARHDKIMQSEDATLSRKELQEKTGHVVGVRDVGFDVAPGEFFVVMGLSGSGKSTLVRLLTRLIEPTAAPSSCSARTSRDEDDALLDAGRQKVSMVFEHFGCCPPRGDRQHRVRPRGARRGKGSRATGAGDGRPGRLTLRDDWPDAALRGHGQRVGVARALAADPDIMMFDEPFSAPDPLIRRDMQDRSSAPPGGREDDDVDHPRPCRGAQARRRILIMRDGEIIQVGAPDEVVAAPPTTSPRLRERRAPVARADPEVGDA